MRTCSINDDEKEAVVKEDLEQPFYGVHPPHHKVCWPFDTRPSLKEIGWGDPSLPYQLLQHILQEEQSKFRLRKIIA